MAVTVYISAHGGTGGDYTRKTMHRCTVESIIKSLGRKGWQIVYVNEFGAVSMLRPTDNRLIKLESV